ncbi:MAG: CRTAC1 family protein, partial [Planctomycetes bacterium]|nr:CRTAC1 family protein [Planctomycetota bacterium]
HDADGDLDLYVCRYVVDDPTRVCRPGTNEPRDYCGPERYQAVPDVLFRNRGDGTFEDATRASGIRGALPGLGVACADLTGDGWTDVYVANDRRPNQLWVNRGDGTFADEAMERGAALSGGGEPEASMGVAVGDANGDQLLDVFVTNLLNETHTLYLASSAGGRITFADRSSPSGLGASTLPYTGWGCGFLDIDSDGDVDLALVNGRIARGKVLPGAAAAPFWAPYAEPAQLFLNGGGGRFAEARELGGAFTGRVECGRGLALGDLDGDGDEDLATVSLDGALRLHRNDAPRAGARWLRVRAVTGTRDALGALVRVEAGGRRQVRPVLSAYSFASASEPVAHFGLGAAERVDRLEVLWPGGALERFPEPPLDRTVTVRQGAGAR